jgi:hypothetical protein
MKKTADLSSSLLMEIGARSGFKNFIFESKILQVQIQLIFNQIFLSGGAGSGGCIFTGPYEPMIITKEEWSDESFESTEESDAAIDYDDVNGTILNVIIKLNLSLI